MDQLNAISTTSSDVFRLVNCVPLGMSGEQNRPRRLGHQAFRDAYAASLARPHVQPSSDSRKDAAHYIDLWEAYTSRHALEPYDRIHAARFRETAGVFGPYLESGKSILELGHCTRFGVFSRETYSALYQNYDSDLREPYDLPSDTFDIVLCLEILQYMTDTEASKIGINHDEKGTWNYSGVLNVLYEAFRVLRRGGVLLITTPNATSVDVLGRVLSGHHPYMFDPHVREFAPMQIKALAELTGFELEMFGTFFAWGECSPALRQKLSEIISLLGFDAENRGDDAYFAFRRPLDARDFSTPTKDKNILGAQSSNVLPQPLGTSSANSYFVLQGTPPSPSQSRLAGAYHYLCYSDRVEGWLYQTTALAMMELLWLQEEAGLGGNSAEIGVHHGCSTLAIIAAARPDETIYAIDIFGRQDLNISNSGQGDLEIFQEHVRYFFPDAHVEFIAKSSFAIRGEEKDNNLIDIRFFSIDGDHSKPATLNDLAIADACLAPHGIACLDDVYNVQWTGVASALFEFLDQEPDLVPFAMLPNKLFLCRAAYTGFYQEKFRSVFKFAIDKRSAELMNYFIDVYGERWPHLTKRLAALEVRAAAAFRIDQTKKKALPIKRRILGRPGDQTGILDFLLQQIQQETRHREAAQWALEVTQVKVESLEASRSWRITAPLRAPRRIFHALANRIFHRCDSAEPQVGQEDRAIGEPADGTSAQDRDNNFPRDPNS